MNLLATIADNEAVTVRGLIRLHNSMELKQGLIKAGVAQDNHQLHRVRDELIIWDDEGNVLWMYAVGGVYFKTIELRSPYNPTSGTIIASLNETKKIHYAPVPAVHVERCNDDELVSSEYLENNCLHFMRADHPDVLPFMSVSPLWLGVPEFQELLNQFSAGDYSDLNSITHVAEPKCGLTVMIPEANRQRYAPNVVPVFFGNHGDHGDNDNRIA